MLYQENSGRCARNILDMTKRGALLCLDLTNGTGLLRWRCCLQATPMHQPWQKLVIETNVIEFASGEYLANRPTAAARQISTWMGGLHAIADLKHLRHLVSPFSP
jgi:hypothetical protein